MTTGEVAPSSADQLPPLEIGRRDGAPAHALNTPDQSAPAIFVRLRKPTPSAVYETYWHFAAERQEIFFKRLSGESPPWTADWILQNYKFTNAYRASDRVSQYLIRHVIYDGPQDPRDTILRTLLFKLFNKIETWQLLEAEVGTIESKNFDVGRYAKVLGNAMLKGTRIYSGAYIMPSATRQIGMPKHLGHLHLLQSMLAEGLTEKLCESTSMADVFALLKSYRSIGDFLAYQFATDINYSLATNFSETEFVVPGPGALNGIRKCFDDYGDMSEADIIRYVTEQQEEELLKRELDFKSLWGRDLQLIDCQNLFCEVDKYARVRHPEIAGVSARRKIKQRFVACRTVARAWYPPKWQLNASIAGAAQ